MSDPSAAPPPAPPTRAVTPPAPPPNRGLGWFLAISGVVVVPDLGCILLAVQRTAPSAAAMPKTLPWVLVCGSPTLLLGGLFLWLGTRRLKR